MTSGEVAEGDAGGEQGVRPGLDDDLLFVAARGIDLGDARHGAQAGLHDEVVDELQLHELRSPGRGLVRGVVPVIDDVVEYLAQAGGDGCELRGDAGGQLLGHILHAFADELAGAVDVGVVAEDEGDLRKARLGERAQLRHAGHAAHLHLDGERDELFDFLGGQAADLRVDLHLHVGDVGGGVDGQPQGGPDARAKQREGSEHDEGALAEGEFQNFVDHGWISRGLVAVAAALGQAELGEPELFDAGGRDHVARIESVEDFKVVAVIGADRLTGVRSSLVPLTT
jgi:hypothetical protein